MLKWQRLTDYVIESGEYRIAKYEIGGRWYYNAWRGFTLIGGFPSAEEAKAELERVEREKT